MNHRGRLAIALGLGVLLAALTAHGRTWRMPGRRLSMPSASQSTSIGWNHLRAKDVAPPRPNGLGHENQGTGSPQPKSLHETSLDRPTKFAGADKAKLEYGTVHRSPGGFLLTRLVSAPLRPLFASLGRLASAITYCLRVNPPPSLTSERLPPRSEDPFGGAAASSGESASLTSTGSPGPSLAGAKPYDGLAPLPTATNPAVASGAASRRFLDHVHDVVKTFRNTPPKAHHDEGVPTHPQGTEAMSEADFPHHPCKHKVHVKADEQGDSGEGVSPC